MLSDAAAVLLAAVIGAACGGVDVNLGGSTSTSTTAASSVLAPTSTTAAPEQPAAGTDRETQSDLRNALTAAKVYFIDESRYTDSTSILSYVDPSLDWGGRLRVRVGDAERAGDHATTCLSEVAASGVTYAIADVGFGPQMGIYYGPHPCPAELTPANLAALGESFAPSA